MARAPKTDWKLVVEETSDGNSYLTPNQREKVRMTVQSCKLRVESGDLAGYKIDEEHDGDVVIMRVYER